MRDAPSALRCHAGEERDDGRLATAVDAVWAQRTTLRGGRVIAAIDALAAERPANDAAPLFETAGARDFAGREAEAEPLYRAALAHGLPSRPGAGRRPARQHPPQPRPADEALGLLRDFLAAQPEHPLADAARAFAALALFDDGMRADALREALGALAPHLPRYGRAVTAYAAALERLRPGGMATLSAQGEQRRIGRVRSDRFDSKRQRKWSEHGRMGIQPNVFDRLLKDRIIWLGSEVRDENANEIAAKLLLLAAEDPKRDIYLYINSPGGSITAGMAIYDTMQFVPNDIVTVGIGMAASMGQLLLTAGTKGKRYITPNARVLLHQPHGGFGGTASDIQTQAQLIIDMKNRLAEITAEATGKSVEQINADGDRDRWFTAQQALEYGFVDHIRESALDVAGGGGTHADTK